jgi:hypothetical protein
MKNEKRKMQNDHCLPLTAHHKTALAKQHLLSYTPLVVEGGNAVCVDADWTSAKRR